MAGAEGRGRCDCTGRQGLNKKVLAFQVKNLDLILKAMGSVEEF